MVTSNNILKNLVKNNYQIKNNSAGQNLPAKKRIRNVIVFMTVLLATVLIVAGAFETEDSMLITIGSLILVFTLAVYGYLLYTNQ